jgi:hypothetical protein
MFVVVVYPATLCGRFRRLPGDTHCLALLKPWKPIGNQKARFRTEIEPLDFHSTKYFKLDFAVCFAIIIMPEHGVVRIVYTV